MERTTNMSDCSAICERVFGNTAAKYMVARPWCLNAARSRVSEEITSYESSFKRELVAFHEAVTAGTVPATPGADGLRDIALCQSIVESFRSRAPIEKPSLPR